MFLNDMKIVGLLFLVSVLGLSAAGQHAQAKEISQQEFEKIQKKHAAKKQISFDFTETRFTALRGHTTTSSGKASFKAPGKFHWKQTERASAWISNGSFYYQYDEREKSAIRYNADTERGRELKNILSLITNIGNLTSQYKIKSRRLVDKILTVEMEPKSAGELVSVDVTFDTKRNFITSLEFLFRNKNKNTYQFSSFETGPVADARFELPKGTKVKNES